MVDKDHCFNFHTSGSSAITSFVTVSMVTRRLTVFQSGPSFLLVLYLTAPLSSLSHCSSGVVGDELEGLVSASAGPTIGTVVLVLSLFPAKAVSSVATKLGKFGSMSGAEISLVMFLGTSRMLARSKIRCLDVASWRGIFSDPTAGHCRNATSRESSMLNRRVLICKSDINSGTFPSSKISKSV